MTEPSLLDNMVELVPNAMDISEIEVFVAREQAISFADDAPLFKLWIIPSKDPLHIYIVSKWLHCVSDGLDMLQMYSMLQDDKSLRTTNAIVRPARPTANIFNAILNVFHTVYSFHVLWQREFYRHLSWIKDMENGRVTNKRELSIGGDISVTEIKAKAKALGATFSEYVLAAITVACYEITDGKEKLPINFTVPMSVGGP